jgi:hypothetical protein
MLLVLRERSKTNIKKATYIIHWTSKADARNSAADSRYRSTIASAGILDFWNKDAG